MSDTPSQIVQALFRATLSAKEEIAQINDDLKSDRKSAVEEHGLNTRALNLCVSIKKMEQVKRQAFLDAFDNYRHTLKLDEAHQDEMFESKKTERAASNG